MKLFLVLSVMTVVLLFTMASAASIRMPTAHFADKTVGGRGTPDTSSPTRHYHVYVDDVGQQRGKRGDTTAVYTHPKLSIVEVAAAIKEEGKQMTTPLILEGSYAEKSSTTGWNLMHLTTNATHMDEDQAYAAGYFEGTVSAHLAKDHYFNQYGTSSRRVTPVVNTFMQQNMEWLRKQAFSSLNTTDGYWYQVGLMLHQFEGLLDGINHMLQTKQKGAVTSPVFTFELVELLALTAMGDLFDLDAYFNRPSDWRSMNKDEFESWFIKSTHCSALVKVTPALDDIFFGHASWNDFSTAVRIFKHVTLNYNHPLTTAKQMSYSSYPGMLSSFDDYYVLDSGLAVLETSLDVLNNTMYDGNIRTDTVPYWVRVMVSNRVATSGQSWTEFIAKYNSGTYNNQYMVLDFNKFTPKKDLIPGTLWVAEQMPGVVSSTDVTDILRYGYYPGYNVIMNRELYVQAGYQEAVDKNGPSMLSYDLCFRAKIFRRDQSKVHDLKSMQYMMQYNDYENDPFSYGIPLYGISARGDLFLDNPGCFGAFDAKITSYSMWQEQKGSILAFSGPTPQQPTFSFNTTRAKCRPHAGAPDTFDFTWQTMKPNSP